MIKLLPLIPGLFLLLLGGEGLVYASRSREIASIACDRFSRERPRSHRVQLTGCEVDYAGAAYRESGDRVVELFYPVRPAGTPAGTPAVAIIATRSEAATSVVEAAFGEGQQPSQEASIAAMRKALQAIQPKGSLIGLARSTMLARWQARTVVSGLSAPIAENAAVIDLGGTSGFAVPLLEGTIGLLLLAVPVLMLRREAGQRAARPAKPVALEALGPPLEAPSEAAPVRPAAAMPAIMLLNLNAAADVGELESAPPLGSRADVIEILRGVVPDLAIDRDRGTALKSDAIAVDIGGGDPVATAVVTATGSGAHAAVREILEMTGWRGYAPKTGRFVSADDLDGVD